MGSKIIKSQSSKLPLAGGTMTGSVDCDSNHISNIGHLTAGDLTLSGTNMVNGISSHPSLGLGAGSATVLTTQSAIKSYINALAPIWKFNYQVSGRFYTRYNNWYFGGSAYDGLNNGRWNNGPQTNGANPNLVFRADWCPPYIVPDKMTITNVSFAGSGDAETYEFCVLKGTPNWTDSNHTTVALITAVIAYTVTAAQKEQWSTGISVGCSPGDIIFPAFRRTTNNSSSYRTVRGVFQINGVYT